MDEKHVTNVWRVWSRTFILQVNTDNIVMWETQHNNADLDYFKTLILQEILKTQHQHQQEFLCIFGSRTFASISWMCKKQTSVSHSSTEAEIISLDAGLRMDGIPALTHWDLVIEIFRSEPNKIEQPKEELRGNPLQATKPNMHNFIQFKHTNVIPTKIDHISSNTIHSGVGAKLYVFQDNEAVIKMILKGRSPTMWHVSRTTEFLWIGFLTGSIWTPKSKSFTMTPNTKSQTSWPKGISRVISGMIFFIF